MIKTKLYFCKLFNIEQKYCIFENAVYEYFYFETNDIVANVLIEQIDLLTYIFPFLPEYVHISKQAKLNIKNQDKSQTSHESALTLLFDRPKTDLISLIRKRCTNPPSFDICQILAFFQF